MKSLKRRTLTGAFATAASAALVVVATAMPAQATTSEPPSVSAPTAADVQGVRDILNKFEVPAAQQGALIQKAKDGQGWDVWDPNATPVSTESGKVISGFKYDIKRYADGSVAATGLEIPKVQAAGGISPRSISQCTYTSGSGYANAQGCQIDGIWGTVLIGAANVSYTLVNGAGDKINSTGYGYQRCNWPTTCNSPSRVVYRATELGSSPAYAKWQSDVTAPTGSWNVWVALNVSHDTAWQTNS